MNIIINADDCGISEEVDNEIERFIQLGKITSTTVMANMNDINGAKRLYERYHDTISFGVHINLTDGEPLTRSQALLDLGFLKEVDGKVFLNGYPFIKKHIPYKYHLDIIKECLAQINCIRDMGMTVSHIDSHHLMLSSQSMVNITPIILKESGVNKMRRARNYMDKKSLSFYVRQFWFYYMKTRVRCLRSTDWQDGFTSFYNYAMRGFYKKGSIELMTHPGSLNYSEENKLMLSIDYSKHFENCQLINFNQL